MAGVDGVHDALVQSVQTQFFAIYDEIDDRAWVEASRTTVIIFRCFILTTQPYRY